MKHIASCCCGQLKLICKDEIKRTSLCHCFECQKRTGSVFGVQTRFEKNATTIEGQSTEFVRVGEEGGKIRLYFCPICGSTVYWYIEVEGFNDSIFVALGAFADPSLPAPTFSVYKTRKHHWVETPASVIDDWD